MGKLLSGVAIYLLLSNSALSGLIDRACRATGNDRASEKLCHCLQIAADAVLTGSDQKRVSLFVEDPELSHSTKVSDSWKNEAFWKRYTEFNKLADEFCSHDVGR